jgi:hypothetical protein
VRWDQDTRDDVDMALNEADVLGLRLEPCGAWCDLLLHVVALPESGPIDPDARRILRLSVDARLIRVDLQEHVADAQRHALRVRDNDFDLPHVVDHRRRPPMAQRILSAADCRVLLARARRLGEPATPAVVCVMGAGEERRTVDLYAPSGPELLLWPAWMLRVMPAASKSEVPISHTISTGDS